MEQSTPRGFVRSYLPWLLAAGMLLLYLVTLNRHVSLASVLPVARGTGLDWHPTFIAPFTWLVTLPARWLPGGAQLVTLNFIGALCGALTLLLLARSVSILPHDRTHDQRLREQNEHSLLSIPTAWIAPMFAVLLCGLQRSFWENAIVCTGETIDTLLMAYVIRCLLEFRLDGRSSWLYKLALVYGIGIANNFAFIAFAPAMLVALLWLKKLKFFEFSFLLRFVLLGFAGLLFYLLLPIVQSMNSTADTTFWTALKVNLGYEKMVLLGFPRWKAYWLGGYPLILMLVISVRWSSGWGDVSRIGGIVATVIAHLVHLSLLGFAIWMAFDLPASPRWMGQPLTFLGSYYIGALAAGYFVGYLLLVFSDFSASNKRPGSAIMVPLSYFVTVLVCTIALVVPLKLGLDNWRRVRTANAPELHDYAARLVASLPQQPAVVFSDDPLQLYAVSLLGARQHGHILIDTHSLTNGAYMRFLKQQYGAAMPPLPPEARQAQVPGSTTIALFSALKKTRELIYLHPSFGYFFETFYQEPRGLVYRLEFYPTNQIEAPVPSAATMAQQADTWNRLVPALRPLEARVAKIKPEQQAQTGDLLFATRAYSHALDWWAVELQRAGRMEDAARYLDLALGLNPDNASAYITREANIEWRKGQHRLERMSEAAQSKLAKQQGIEGLLNNCGPVDEPSFQSEIMQVFAQNGLWRQAAQHILRALAFVPNDTGFEIALANIYLGWGQPDRTLALLPQIRARNAAPPPPLALELARTEAAAQFVKDNFGAAEKILKDAVRQFPAQDGGFLALCQLYVSQSEALRRAGNAAGANQAMSNAVATAEQHVRQQPRNPTAYFNLGNLHMYRADYEQAIAAFTKAIEFDPQNFAALLNRAIANLQAKKLPAAQKDYEELLSRTTTSFRVYYGLAEVAYQKKDWRAARDNYRKYLQYAPPASEETRFVRTRLAEVKKKA